MENYWSLARLAGRWRHPHRRQDKTLLGTPEAAAGIQFLQDLIYKDKVMAEPRSAETGDAFEQGQAAMEANGSWLVPTTRRQAAGIDSGSPPPEGTAGRATSVNPSGVVVYKGSKSPDAAWEFVKFLASPAAQEQLMPLKASLPANKQVLAGPYATSSRAPTCSPTRSRTPTSSRRSRATTSSPRAPGRARHQGLQRARRRRRGARGYRAAARRAPRQPVTRRGGPAPAAG